jgi:ABC-type transport system involved in multi-copper enzyme maturation permease subunit
MMNLLANPVLQQEMRRRMRGHRAMIILTVYLVLISLITMLIFLAFIGSHSIGMNPNFGVRPNIEEGRELGKAIFITVIVSALIQVYIITPTLTAGAVSSEKDRQTYDLLITTLLSPWDIIIGKMLASLAYATLLVFATLPVAGIAFMFGGVSGIELVTAMVILLATVVLCSTIGMFWSVIASSTHRATVRSQGTTILLLLVVPFSLLLMGIAGVDRWDIVEELANIPIVVYIAGAIFCFNPFITFAMTEILLSTNENPFFFTIDPGRGDILVPAPWIAYAFTVLLVAGVLLVISVRMLKPVQYTVRRKKKQ